MKPIKYTSTIARWLLALALVIAAPAFAQTQTKAQTLALNWKAEAQFGGFYAAKEGGAFARRQLDINVVEGGSGTPTVQMLAAGKVNYAIVSGDEIVIAHARGADNIVALFAVYQTNPQGIMVHSERDFKSLAEVMQSDGTLLWQAGLPYAQYFKKKFAPIKVKTAPYLGGIGHFQNDPNVSQQCFVTSEPLTAAKAGLKVKTFLVAESGYNPYTTVLATTREYLQQHPQEVKNMVAAVREGWTSYLSDPSPANVRMAALNKSVDAAALGASAQAQRGLIETRTTRKLGEMTMTRWQQLSDQLTELGIVKRPIATERLFVDM